MTFEQRIVELTAFVAHLAAAHEQLGGPAPMAACGPGCGCVAEAPSGTVMLELTGPVSGAAR